MSIGTLPAAAGTQHELRIRALDHAFGRDEVLAGIDFRLRAGEVVALVGPLGLWQDHAAAPCCRSVDGAGG